MRIRSWQAVAPLVAVLLALLLNMPPANGRPLEGKAKVAAKELQGRQNPCPGQVCPVILVGTYPTYYSYYAFNCDTHAPCLLDDSVAHDCKTPCSGDCHDCVPLQKYKGAWPAVHHVAKRLVKKGEVGKDLTGGLQTKAKPSDPKLQDPCKHIDSARLLGPPLLINLATTKGASPNKAKVLLFLIFVDLSGEADPTVKKQPPMVFATGQEVDTMEDGANIPYSIVGVLGKVCQVKLGSVTYQVVLHKTTPLDAP
jgi:hypothetical protein